MGLGAKLGAAAPACVLGLRPCLWSHLEGLNEGPQKDADGVSLPQQLDEAGGSEEPQETQVDHFILGREEGAGLESTMGVIWRHIQHAAHGELFGFGLFSMKHNDATSEHRLSSLCGLFDRR